VTDELVEVELTALAAGGDAVGRDAAGRAVFVAVGTPDELVRARVIERHRSFARAELVEVVRRSPARVPSPCPYQAAGTCGGCPWMHVARDAQLEAKQALVRGALRRLIARGLALGPIAAPVPPLRWRRRVRMHRHGVAIGFHAPRSRRVTDVASCLQLDVRLEAAIGAVRTAGATSPGDLHAIVGHGGDVHLVGAGLPAALVGRAGIVGVVTDGGVHGADAIEIEPGLVGAADAFAQASAAGNAALVAAVVAAVAPRPGLRVLELFGGAGNFTRALSAAGAVVVVNDVRPPPAPPAGARFEPGPADQVIARLAAAGERFDVVLLDPPRTGAVAAARALAALAAARVVYVACDAATLARDLEIIAAAGWTPRTAAALDLMPQTAHVEIVAVSER
jgi:23S rRNA (uracil1939-C5)-methyltransferase